MMHSVVLSLVWALAGLPFDEPMTQRASSPTAILERIDQSLATMQTALKLELSYTRKSKGTIGVACAGLLASAGTLGFILHSATSDTWPDWLKTSILMVGGASLLTTPLLVKWLAATFRDEGYLRALRDKLEKDRRLIQALLGAASKQMGDENHSEEIIRNLPHFHLHRFFTPPEKSVEQVKQSTFLKWWHSNPARIEEVLKHYALNLPETTSTPTLSGRDTFLSHLIRLESGSDPSLGAWLLQIFLRDTQESTTAAQDL